MATGQTSQSSRNGAGDERDQAFGRLMDTLANEPQNIFDEQVARWRGRIDAEEARRLAAKIGDDGDLRDAGRAARNGGRRSSRAARAAAKRAAAVKANPELGDKMASGEMTAEQVDTIGDAMETDPAAATDQNLIDSVGNASVDQGRKLGREWAAKNSKAKSTQDEHDRQRSIRGASKYKDHSKGVSAIKFEGDDSTINRMWNQLLSRSKAMHQADGGRDLARNKHQRTFDHRMFDAAAEMILGANSSTSAGGGAKPVAVLDIPIDKLADPERCAELIGSGPIPDSVLVELLQNADVWFQISGLKGQPLWLARDARNATRAQLIAMILRDKGCVQCGAHYLNCEAHHNTPYNSPAKGETNVDDMTLNCPGDHHYLHNNNLTLIPNEAGNGGETESTWTTRPATPDEIAPKKRKPPPGSVSKSTETSTRRKPAA